MNTAKTIQSNSSLQTLPRNVKLLGFASLLNDIASEMVFPLLPHLLIGTLGGNKFLLGIIEGFADTVASLLKLWSGAWSDRAGKRKSFILTGYGLAVLIRPLLSFATVPWHVFAARTADRIGKGIRTAPRDALIADSTPPGMRGRAFGFHRAMDHVGAAIGPLVAFAFLWAWPEQLRLLFLLTAIPGLLVFLLLAWGLREKRVVTQPTTKEPFSLTLKPFDLRFRMYLAALVVFTLGNSSDAFLLVRAEEVGVDVTLLPILWFVFHVIKSAGNLLAGPVVDRFGPRPLIFLGWLVYACIYFAFAFVEEAWHVWALFLLYGLFFALTEPAEKTLVTLIVGPERKGLAFGWFNFAIGISSLPASLLFGFLYQRYGAIAAFSTGGTLAVTAACLLIEVRPIDDPFAVKTPPQS